MDPDAFTGLLQLMARDAVDVKNVKMRTLVWNATWDIIIHLRIIAALRVMELCAMLVKLILRIRILMNAQLI